MENKQIKIFENSEIYDTYEVDLDRLYYRKITQRVNKYSKKTTNRLLDIGCFDGTFASTFKGEWAEVHGIEGNPGACKIAREKGVHIVERTLEKPLPYDDETFDCVIAAEVIEHVFDTNYFLREIRRVLTKEGVLVLSVPNISCFTNRFLLFFGRYPRYTEYEANTAGGHIRVYTAPRLKQQIKKNGYDLLELVGCNLPMPMHSRWIPRWIKKMSDIGGNILPGLSGQIIVTARKKAL